MTDVVDIEVFCPGMLEVLSIGKGDLKITIGDNEEDRQKARSIIEEMLRKGYSIFIETEDGVTRVQRFNPERLTYTIVELVSPDETAAIAAPVETRALPSGEPKPKAKPARRTQAREVPVAGTKARAIGRTSGG